MAFTSISGGDDMLPEPLPLFSQTERNYNEAPDELEDDELDDDFDDDEFDDDIDDDDDEFDDDEFDDDEFDDDDEEA